MPDASVRLGLLRRLAAREFNLCRAKWEAAITVAHNSSHQSGKHVWSLTLPVTLGCYSVVRCVLQVLLPIWEGQLPHGNQAHWGMDSTEQLCLHFATSDIA